MRTVAVSAVRAEFMAAYVAGEGDKADAKRMAFNRALKTARERDLICSREIEGVDYLWFVNSFGSGHRTKRTNVRFVRLRGGMASAEQDGCEKEKGKTMDELSWPDISPNALILMMAEPRNRTSHQVGAGGGVKDLAQMGSRTAWASLSINLYFFW